MKLIKKLLLPIILFILFFVTIKKDNKISYLSLGDALSKGINYEGNLSTGYSDYVRDFIQKKGILKRYTKDFSDEDIRITDLINIINDNISIKQNNEKITIQNAIKNADLITLSIGMNEIVNKYQSNLSESKMYKYIDECMNDMNILIKKIAKLENKNIYILGFYNPYVDKSFDKYIKYANNKIIDISSKNKLNYVNLYKIFDNNKHLIYNINNYYPNEDGYKLIANEIIKMYDKNNSFSETTLTSSYLI